MRRDPPIRTFAQFRDAIYAFRLPRILMTALELDLFSLMGNGSWSIGRLATALHASERGVSILCRNLASAGLLIKKGAQFRNSRLGATLLNRHHADFRGAYLDLLHQQWKDWSSLTASVKSGKPGDADAPDDPAYRKSFTWAMHHRSIEAAAQVARQVTFRGARTLLDVGGGPGTYAMAFLAKNANLHATVWDRPAALDVAQDIARSSRQRGRFHVRAGDFLKDPVPGSFDVMWLSNVIHIYSPRENIALLRKLRAALRSGGRLLVQDTFLTDSEGLFPQETNLFAVTMLLFTETGNTYSARDVEKWLRQAGLSRVKRIHLQKGTGDWEGVLIEGRR